MIEHFEAEYPREACGLLLNSKFYPIKNIAKNEVDFILDPEEYLAFIKKHGKPDFIVHTHPDYGCEPSQYDIDCCNAIGVPFVIYSYPSLDRHELRPEVKHKAPLLGRTYEFGKMDCFEAVRDWYLNEGLDILPRLPFEDDWWYKGLNYFNEVMIESYGFTKVTDLKEGDLLTFTMMADVPNHCAVYIGNDIIYHHAFNRLSCRENMYPLWAKFLTGIYRHEKKLNI